MGFLWEIFSAFYLNWWRIFYLLFCFICAFWARKFDKLWNWGRDFSICDVFRLMGMFVCFMGWLVTWIYGLNACLWFWEDFILWMSSSRGFQGICASKIIRNFFSYFSECLWRGLASFHHFYLELFGSHLRSFCISSLSSNFNLHLLKSIPKITSFCINSFRITKYLLFVQVLLQIFFKQKC